MIITKQDLNQFGLLDKLPKELKELPAGEFFVFYYSVDEENVKLKVYETETIAEPNLGLYRGLQQKQNKYQGEIRVGVFSDSFDTKDGLFFQFLKTYNDNSDVYSFYNSIIEQDKVTDLNVSTNAISEINNPDDFRRAISYFSPSRMQPIMFVYDLVNQAFKNKLGRSLYGDSIKRVVNLVKFEGGVLPEWDNSLLRYMIIGKNANLSDLQKQRLEEADVLIRSLNPIEKIYSKTGWALGEKDGKWRTNIADNEAIISTDYLVEYGGKRLYVPKGLKPEEILPLTLNPLKLYSQRYTGKLSDVLKHPTLYKYYPKLASLPLVYFYQDKSMGTQPMANPQEFYFSDNQRGGFILINGSYAAGDSLSILLHEIQHAIQRIEGYATGGNLFLAQFVSSVGSDSVRKIFASINRMQHYFRDYLFDSRVEIQEILRNSYFNSREAASLRDTLLKEFLADQTSYEENYKSVNFYLVLMISEEKDFNSKIFEYLVSKIGNLVYDLFETISNGYDNAKKFEDKLMSEGYTKGRVLPDGSYKRGDIDTILFKGYENLYGEMESRSVQSSRYVQSEYKNYFYLTHWEMEPLQQLTVIDGVEEVIDTTKVVGACESIDDKYILHFKQEYSVVPYLHELGHIVYDALVRLGYKEKIIAQYDKQLYFTNVDEYFVAKFLGYIKDTINDPKIKQDMIMDLKISSDVEISKILDEFLTDITLDSRKQFVNKILSLINE